MMNSTTEFTIRNHKDKEIIEVRQEAMANGADFVQHIYRVPRDDFREFLMPYLVDTDWGYGAQDI